MTTSTVRWSTFAAPSRFYRLADALNPWLWGAALALALEGGARWLEQRRPRPKVAAYLWSWERMWQGDFYTLGGGSDGWPPEAEVNADGTVRSAGYAPYLDYRPLTTDEEALAAPLRDLDWLKDGLEQCVPQYAVTELVPPHLADVPRNLALHEKAVRDAAARGAELVVFPELSLTGYALEEAVPEVAIGLAHPTMDALRALSGYRAFDGPEDYDLWLRGFAAGWRFAKHPETLLDWRDRAGRLTRSDPRYGEDRFRALKAEALVRRHIAPGRAVVLWGAGPIGKAWSP